MIHSTRAHYLCPERMQMRGFTLLEVLLAIMVTALIGLGSWQLLGSAIRTDELTEKRQTQLSELQKAMLIIERDLQQMVPRAIRDGYGDYRPALFTRDEFYSLEFSRAGWRNPLGDKRSEIQRVAYELDQNELVRHYWTVLDRAQDSESIRRVLLKDVEEVAFRFMNESGGWVDEWPSDQSSGSTGSSAGGSVDPMEKYNALPKAVELTIELKAFGEIRRLFELVNYMPRAAFPAKSGGGNTNNGQNNTGQNANNNQGAGG